MEKIDIVFFYNERFEERSEENHQEMANYYFEYKNQIVSHETILKTLNCPGQIILKICTGKYLTKEELDQCEFTTIMRLASSKQNDSYLYPSLVKNIYDCYGYNPLPMKTFSDKNTPIFLFNHQIKAVKWIHERELLFQKNDPTLKGLCGSLLYLQMGLGKTLISVCHSLMMPKTMYDPLTYNISDSNPTISFPSLIVASKTVMVSWKRDCFDKFFNGVKVLYLHSDHISKKTIQNLSKKDMIKYDFVITTYDFILDASKLNDDWKDTCEIEENKKGAQKIISVNTRTLQQTNKNTTGARIVFFTPWERIILDESQKISSPSTATYRAIMSLYGKYKLCLSGTPLRNNQIDLWAQLRFLGYNTASKQKEWEKAAIQLMKAHKLNDCILKMTYEDTDIVLPPKKNITVECELTQNEKKIYNYALNVVKIAYNEMLKKKIQFISVLAMLTFLRQICIAPYLLTNESKIYQKSKNESPVLQKLIGSELWNWVSNIDGEAGIYSSKMKEVVKIIKSIPKTEKIQIFSMFTSCLHIISQTLKKEFGNGLQFDIIDGSVSGKKREEIIETFTHNPDLRILLSNYKVGSEGLNLTMANHVILMDQWWTHVETAQAESRCWRPGQDKNVFVYNIIIKNSIEYRMLEICADKKNMAESMLSGAKNINKIIDVERLGKILGDEI